MDDRELVDLHRETLHDTAKEFETSARLYREEAKTIRNAEQKAATLAKAVKNQNWADRLNAALDLKSTRISTEDKMIDGLWEAAINDPPTYQRRKPWLDSVGGYWLSRRYLSPSQVRDLGKIVHPINKKSWKHM